MYHNGDRKTVFHQASIQTLRAMDSVSGWSLCRLFRELPQRRIISGDAIFD